MANIPENLQESDNYIKSEEAVEALEEALDSLEEIKERLGEI